MARPKALVPTLLSSYPGQLGLDPRTLLATVLSKSDESNYHLSMLNDKHKFFESTAKTEVLLVPEQQSAIIIGT